MSRCLVIRGGAIGDFILTLPVLAALRGPSRNGLEILGYPAIASLAVAGGLADRVRAIEDPALAGCFSVSENLPAAAAPWLQGFDSIVSYLYDPKGVFQRNVAAVCQARYIAGPHKPDERSPLHATEQLLWPLQELGIQQADPHPKLRLPAAGPVAWRIAVHPGSGSPRKNWPEEKWAALLELVLTKVNCEILLIGGEAEGGRCERLARTSPASRIQVAQNLPLVELAARLQTCKLFIGHDSGITHLAAALGLRGLALWGETNATVWRPLSDHFQIVRDARRGLSALSVDAVLAALRG